MTDKRATAEAKNNVRQQFYAAAKASYPDVSDPGAVWVLTEVLGWDWDKLCTVPEGGISRDGYRVFALNADGTKKYNLHQGEAVIVSRRWSKAEKSLLKDWWWLLGL